MTKATHTPGPWERFPVPGHGLEVWTEGDGPRDSGLPSAKPICEVLTTAADANLIAAAPDLLAACQELINTAHVTTARCSFGIKLTPRANPCDCSEHAGYFRALAAIAKAKGGAQ